MNEQRKKSLALAKKLSVKCAEKASYDPKFKSNEFMKDATKQVNRSLQAHNDRFTKFCAVAFDLGIDKCRELQRRDVKAIKFHLKAQGS